MRPRVGRLPLPTLVHGLTLLVGFIVLTAIGRHLWFDTDEWDFIANRGFHHPIYGFMVPHNEHWSALPIVIWRVTFTLIGLHRYWPYLMFVTIAHLVAVHLLWRLANRLDVTPWLATAMVGSVALLGIGYENLEWAFQIGFVGSVTFGMGGILLALDLHEGWQQGRRLIAVWVVAILGLTCSGVGVTMVIGVTGVALVVRGMPTAILVASVPTAVYAGWYLVWGSSGVAADSYGVTGDNVNQVPAFITNGFAATLGRWLNFSDAGPTVIVLLVLLVATRRLRGMTAIPLVLMVTALIFYAITAVGRVGLGVTESEASRYSYTAMFLLFPAILLGLDLLVRRGGLVVPVGLACLLAVAGVIQLRAYDLDRSSVERADRSRILADAFLLQTHLPVVAVNPLLSSTDLHTASLALLARGDALPDFSHVPASELPQAHLDLQVAAVAHSVATDLSPSLDLSPTVAVSSASGCATVTSPAAPSQVVINIGAGTYAVSLTVTMPASIDLFSQAAGQAVTAGPNVVAVPAGTTWLRDSESNSYLTLGLPAGTAQICHIAAV